MRVLLTGATGYVGSAVREALLDEGHDVVAVARSAVAAEQLAATRARALRGDISDRPWLVDALRSVDAAVHAASPNDRRSGEVDQAVADAVLEAFSGTAKKYLHTSGVWIWGAGQDITETSSIDPPRIVAWRIPIEEVLLASDIAVTIPALGVVHGGYRGSTRLLAPTSDEPSVVRLIGSGTQRWSLIHIDDVGSFYASALATDRSVGRAIVVGRERLSVSEIARRLSNGAAATPETDDESRQRLGRSLTDALLLDQWARNDLARSIGWEPVGPLLGERSTDSHRPSTI